ncbi:MAG: nicotinate-nucleotide adenylyltransferase [Chloroflexi bacterium AL-W]|nr:nicotinate-nucleotide adenylyltransferase [Chloroflexi bacterium AL-N1]NOK65764.1 nicotinate-nucleotide adenylyltransferase [Chloroflexi bacterium AL-N10]NOK74295.1 nicotinate-nucleotide adenylyltransferase [Chloroflexi bacterium AL-N5]NOK80797.1 nicotinate-nucleotide adenylyltransferase [Chloroflexi bacterium AL-W]NOK88553.1 nicotinate-nucleotide adenylyltransferase [Chloroflexi bacterium AL-N15]
MKRRIGILGGTFDPIHYGHLAIAEEARVALQLSRVLFIPAAQQPLKQYQPMATAKDRLAMVQRACQDNPAFEPSAIEVSRSGVSYTVTTIELLHEQESQELYFIIGTDALADMARWYNVARLLDLTKIVGIKRPGTDTSAEQFTETLPQLNTQLTLLEGPGMTLSSSELRKRLAQGQPIRYLTPDTVISYIETQKLYNTVVRQ